MRVAAFVEWVTKEVLEAVDHRQYVWTIPRVLRPAFRKDRKLLGRLSRCAWISLRQYAQAALGEGFVPGAVVAIQTYGDALNPHEHIHMLASDSAWRPDGGCGSLGEVDSEVLTRLFQHQVLEAMVAERRLSHDFAQKLRSWHPSGFGVHRGRSIECDDRPALERLAAYLLRPSFAASRLQYDPEEGRIEYRTSKGLHRTLDALDWIALVTSHIPNRGEQIRYYGGLGYPFNRTECRLRRWITLVLARTIRGPWASSRPGSAPMRTVWTTWSGCDGPLASLARTAATMVAGGWAMGASGAPGAAAVVR